MKSEEELQALRNYIVDACNEIIESYDWDKAFQKYLDGIEKP